MKTQHLSKKDHLKQSIGYSLFCDLVHEKRVAHIPPVNHWKNSVYIALGRSQFNFNFLPTKSHCYEFGIRSAEKRNWPEILQTEYILVFFLLSFTQGNIYWVFLWIRSKKGENPFDFIRGIFFLGGVRGGSLFRCFFCSLQEGKAGVSFSSYSKDKGFSKKTENGDNSTLLFLTGWC